MRVVSRPELEGLTLRREPGLAWYPASIPGPLLEGHIGPGDAAWRTKGPASDPSLDLECPGPGPARERRMKLTPASGWGIASPDPVRCAELLRASAEALEEEGLRMTATASQAAGLVYRSTYAGDGAPPGDRGQLPPRWWRMARAAIHQGPIAHLRGGARRVAHWDRHGAFLSALRRPMPLRGSWRALRPAFIEDQGDWLDEGEGLVTAIVHARPIHFGLNMGPLPMRANGRTVWPVGYVRGTWTIEELRRAVTAGADIEHVGEVALCDVAPWLAPYADRIDAVQDPALRKTLYTRGWGRFASSGGYRSRGEWSVSPEGEPVTASELYRARLRGSSLPWEWEGADEVTGKAGPDYRPDLATFIAGDNCAALQRAIATIPQGALIAAHVDAVWIDLDRCPGGEWSPPYGYDWILKGTGEMRSYRVGTYAHQTEAGIRLAAMGWPVAGGAPASPEELEEWIAPREVTIPILEDRWTLEQGEEKDIDGECDATYVVKGVRVGERVERAGDGLDRRDFDPELGPAGVPLGWTDDGRRWIGEPERAAGAWSVPCQIEAPPPGILERPTIYAARWSPSGWHARCACPVCEGCGMAHGECSCGRVGPDPDRAGCRLHSGAEPEEAEIRYPGLGRLGS